MQTESSRLADASQAQRPETPENDPGRDDPQKAAKKSAETILRQQIDEETEKLETHPKGVLLSGLSAGLDIGFGPLLMAVMLTLAEGALPGPVTRILVANTYAIGFVFVVMGGSALFTEHTTLAVLPVLDKRATWMDLWRLWGLIYLGNVAGAAIFAGLAAVIGPALGIVKPWAFGRIAHDIVAHPWWVILLSGVLAGWMMGLLSWLVTSGRDTISQVFFVWLVTSGIGLAQLHHCIAGTVEVLMGIFAGQGARLPDFFWFMLWATIGNAVGGGVFVAVIKYGYVVQSLPERVPDDVDWYPVASRSLWRRRQGER